LPGARPHRKRRGSLDRFSPHTQTGQLYDPSDGIDDHLQHYDPAESPKNYLRFSDRAWKLLFENDVQYFNRLQACDWIDRIGSAGFVFLERIAETADVGGLPIAPGFRHYRQEDLACTILTLVHQKPPLVYQKPPLVYQKPH
jgi:hypothetical protein